LAEVFSSSISSASRGISLIVFSISHGMSGPGSSLAVKLRVFENLAYGVRDDQQQKEKTLQIVQAVQLFRFVEVVRHRERSTSPRIAVAICSRSAAAVSPSARRPFRTSPW
jgi:hypothetical protein